MKVLFSLGQIVATPACLDAVQAANDQTNGYIKRHISGDWSEMDPFDQEQNRKAVQGGERVFSAYKLKDGTKIWIITEWDRSATTLLLPSDY